MRREKSIGDINLQSGVFWMLNGFPEMTAKVMFIYDDRGWGLRCYDENGNKLDTLIQDVNASDCLISTKSS